MADNTIMEAINKTEETIRKAEQTISEERINLLLLFIKRHFESRRDNGYIFTAENVIDEGRIGVTYFTIKVILSYSGDVFISMHVPQTVTLAFKRFCFEEEHSYYWIYDIIDNEECWHPEPRIIPNNDFTIQGTLKVRFEGKQNEEVKERVVEIQMKDYSK